MTKMTLPCDKGPTLERIESKLDMLTEIVSRQAVQENDIDHLGSRLREMDTDVKELKEWKDKWGGAAIALGMVGAVLGGLLTVFRLFDYLKGIA